MNAEPFTLWALDLSDLHAGELNDCGNALISNAERQRVNRHRLESDRHLYLAARVLVRLVLSRYADVQPADWFFVQNACGRPMLPSQLEQTIREQNGYANLQFNLSRSGSIVLCAVSTTGLIGVDVEDTTRDFLPAEIADGVLTPDEMIHFMTVPPREQKALLLKYWVLKEAFVKALGVGLAIEPRSIGFEGVASHSITVRSASSVPGPLSLWSFRHLPLFDRYSSAVAYRPSL